MDTVNGETEVSSGRRNPSHTPSNILPTLSLILLPTVALLSLPPAHPAELELFLQLLAGRKSLYDWTGITAGAIRKVILEVAALLWYPSTKNNFPLRTRKGRKKVTGLLSYLLEPDPQLQLIFLYDS